MTEKKYIFGQVRRLMFISVNFLVMFTNFGHIHSVILIWSSEYSSNFSQFSQKFQVLFKCLVRCWPYLGEVFKCRAIIYIARTKSLFRCCCLIQKEKINCLSNTPFIKWIKNKKATFYLKMIKGCRFGSFNTFFNFFVLIIHKILVRIFGC